MAVLLAPPTKIAKYTTYIYMYTAGMQSDDSHVNQQVYTWWCFSRGYVFSEYASNSFYLVDSDIIFKHSSPPQTPLSPSFLPLSCLPSPFNAEIDQVDSFISD